MTTTTPKCQEPDCPNVAALRSTQPNGRKLYKRFCHRHRFALNPPKSVSDLAHQNCSLCGWFGQLHKHRLNKEAGYAFEWNLQRLCPNCHASIHGHGQPNPSIPLEARLHSPEPDDPYTRKPNAPSLTQQNQ